VNFFEEVSEDNNQVMGKNEYVGMFRFEILTKDSLDTVQPYYEAMNPDEHSEWYSNDMNNIHSPNVHYIPLTAQMKKVDLPVHIRVDVNFLPKSSIALCEQIDLEEKSNLMNYIDWNIGCVGKLTEVDMQRIGYGVAVQFNLVPMLKPVMNKQLQLVSA
jgi:spore coat polysaccharide biosynthesis protein SpsF (cytidylyltransferase family)